MQLHVMGVLCDTSDYMCKSGFSIRLIWLVIRGVDQSNGHSTTSFGP